MKCAFIGSVGLPNKYGGFESFVDNCAPVIAAAGHEVIVTCDAAVYEDKTALYKGVVRQFIGVRANGASSILHDLLAFLRVVRQVDVVVVLGVSGGIWFPLFRLLADIFAVKIVVNIDGVEWRRDKFSRPKKLMLKFFDYLAQRFSHSIVYDSGALLSYVKPFARSKSACIKYSGDHVLRLPDARMVPGTALTICRIEPENNLEMLIEGFLLSGLDKYTIIGNWGVSQYSKDLRAKYAAHERLNLLDPMYDPLVLAGHRSACQYYLHGHSVGGTNPSLVEMLFYDCEILCFDVDYNRQTAADGAGYFLSPVQLGGLLGSGFKSYCSREDIRFIYTADKISAEYLSIMK